VKRRGSQQTRRSPRQSDRAQVQPKAAELGQQLGRVFTPEVVDQLRLESGYNPRQRLVTAYQLMFVVVEAFMMGGSGGVLSFAMMRGLFVKRFGFVRPCPFQLRFKQPAAAKFFRAALEYLVKAVITAAGMRLSGPMACFAGAKGNRTGKDGVWRTWNFGPGVPLEMSRRESRAPACPIARR
jgi:hypothetical protein